MASFRASSSESGGEKPIDKYDYMPLKANESRLLEIIPGDLADPLELRLHHVSLDDLPTYGALSYTWGLDTDPRIVFIDENALTVRPNLEAALLAFRRKPAFRVFGLQNFWQVLDISNAMLSEWDQNCIREAKHRTSETPDSLDSLKARVFNSSKLVGEKVEVSNVLFRNPRRNEVPRKDNEIKKISRSSLYPEGTTERTYRFLL